MTWIYLLNDLDFELSPGHAMGTDYGVYRPLGCIAQFVINKNKKKIDFLFLFFFELPLSFNMNLFIEQTLVKISCFSLNIYPFVEQKYHLSGIIIVISM